jgi:Leucine-rich repeat (LRR) protein
VLTHFFSWCAMHAELKAFPADLPKLPKLRRLAMGHNQIVGFPDFVGDLQSLTWLDLTHNHLGQGYLSHRLGDLQNLTGLGLSDCQLNHFPESLGRLSRVLKLGMFNNGITEIPKSIKGMAELTKLDVSNNLIARLPEEMGSLKNLTWLNLR